LDAEVARRKLAQFRGFPFALRSQNAELPGELFVLFFSFGQMKISFPQSQKAIAAIAVVGLFRKCSALFSLKPKAFGRHGGASDSSKVHRSIFYIALQQESHAADINCAGTQPGVTL
jgi:hypothetical protein